MASVGFILDSSGSLRRQYGKEKEFVKQLAESLMISKLGTRAGVVTFSNEAQLSIRFDDFVNIKDFKKAVDDIPHFGSTTRIDKALLVAKNQLMPEARQNDPKILILLTDGVQTKDQDAIDPSTIAQKLREMNIKLIVIGIGRNVDRSELTRIAGDSSNVFLAENFDVLKSDSFISKISQLTCKKGWYQQVLLGSYSLLEFVIKYIIPMLCKPAVCILPR